MPEATFRHRVVADVTSDHAWERLQDPTTWASVAGVDHTTGHQHENGLLKGFQFTAHIAGVSYRGTAHVTHSEPAEAMTVSISSNELRGSIAVDLAVDGAGTAVDVTMRMRPAGLVGSMVFPLVTGAVESGFPASVERFADHLG